MGTGFRVRELGGGGPGFSASGSEVRVWDFGFRVQDLGFRV